MARCATWPRPFMPFPTSPRGSRRRPGNGWPPAKINLRRIVSSFSFHFGPEVVVSLEALCWCASIFLWSFFTGIGLPPLPEEAGILYAAGLATLHSEVHWWMAWPAASLGIIAADLALYSAG